jgi:hypothetical protein
MHSEGLHYLYFTPNFVGVMESSEDHSGRTVEGMNYLRPLERGGRGFETHSEHGCMCVFILCLCRSVY